MPGGERDEPRHLRHGAGTHAEPGELLDGERGAGLLVVGARRIVDGVVIPGGEPYGVEVSGRRGVLPDGVGRPPGASRRGTPGAARSPPQQPRPDPLDLVGAGPRRDPPAQGPATPPPSRHPRSPHPRPPLPALLPYTQHLPTAVQDPRPPRPGALEVAHRRFGNSHRANMGCFTQRGSNRRGNKGCYVDAGYGGSGRGCVAVHVAASMASGSRTYGRYVLFAWILRMRRRRRRLSSSDCHRRAEARTTAPTVGAPVRVTWVVGPRMATTSAVGVSDWRAVRSDLGIAQDVEFVPRRDGAQRVARPRRATGRWSRGRGTAGDAVLPGGGLLGGGVAVGAGWPWVCRGPGGTRLADAGWLRAHRGFVGADDRITIERNGAWTHRDLRFGRPVPWQLARSQIMRLSRLLDAAHGFRPGRPKPGCARRVPFTLVAGGSGPATRLQRAGRTCRRRRAVHPAGRRALTSEMP